MTADPRPVERTADGRYLVIGGRRWRASDPAIPESLRTELVAELMSARRAVRSDPQRARGRVHDAKVALGERGEPWWEVPSPEGRRHRLAAALRVLLRHRGPDATVCSAEVARVVGGRAWHDVLEAVQDVVNDLIDEHVVQIPPSDRDPDPRPAVAPVQLTRGARWGNAGG